MKGEDADEIVGILSEYTEMDEDLLRGVYFPAISADGGMNTEGLADDLQTFREDGLVEEPDLVIDDIIDTSFVEQAGA
ncbi:hypothetical protein ACFFX0_20390 [Citricoccus parietis]|uniref:Uncharacterized protein n=1 Tax=Citricoccus parietis TaxID=592307 RepID=A0ABV5G3B6_9MICC